MMSLICKYDWGTKLMNAVGPVRWGDKAIWVIAGADGWLVRGLGPALGPSSQEVGHPNHTKPSSFSPVKIRRAHLELNTSLPPLQHHPTNPAAQTSRQ